MTFEEFKDVYKDKTPVEKLKLMQLQHDYWRSDTKYRVDANWQGNFEDARYWSGECDGMRDRVAWLHEEITKELEKLEPVKPKKVDAWPRSIYACGNCGNCIVFYEKYKANFCMECGRQVKWE